MVISRVSGAIDSLICGLPQSQRLTRKLLMLTVFMDDSGSDLKPPFCVIAGYVSDPESWKRFSDDWQCELAANPPIRYLKMREAESLRGEFWGWDSVARERKLLRLAAIIKKHVIGGLGSFVSNRAYGSIVKGYLPSTIDHPYWLCFQRIVLDAALVYGQHADGGKVDFVFDGQGIGYERRATMMHQAWQDAANSPMEEMMGGIAFHDDKQILPLQAADMLAWHMRRYLDSGVQHRTENRPVADILWSIPTPSKPWWPHEMEDFVDFYHEIHPQSPRNMKA